jgi:hypothetical protein
MEPDRLALERLLTLGKEKLGKKGFEQALADGQSLRMEDVVAREIPSGD